jgi:hypothetical protein
VLDPDAGVDDGGAVRTDDERIAVELDDLVVSLDHRADAHQDALDGRKVAWRRPPVTTQQCRDSESGEHLGGVGVGHRCDPHRDVLLQLSLGPAGTAGEDGAETRVLDDAEEQLDAVGHHRLDEEPL